MVKGKWLKRVVLILIVTVVLFQVGRQVFKQEEWQARNYIHDQVKTAFPKANKQVQKLYGLSIYGNDQNAGHPHDNRSHG